MFGKYLKFKRKGSLERFIEGERAATRNKRPSIDLSKQNNQLKLIEQLKRIEPLK